MMKVRDRELLALLNSGKDNIRELVKRITDLHGEMSWLYIPKRRKNNICLIAHIDSVWDDERKSLVYDRKFKVIYSAKKFTGIGADDRAGVYALLKVFSELPSDDKPYLLFTDFEEFGGLGAYEAVEKFGDILSDVNFFVEIDRRGVMEFVTYNGEETNQDFINFISSFGFQQTWGTFSDVAIIGEQLGIAGANVSPSYYFGHTYREVLYPEFLADTINRVVNIIQNSRNKVFRLPAVERIQRL